jgi:hypothetical protein
MTKTLALLIAAMIVLAAATPAIVRLLNAATPLVVVVGVLFLAWTLVEHYVRR